MLVTGIDEAGYGPLLGPLVVAGAAFRVGGPEGPAEPAGADALEDAAGIQELLTRGLARRGVPVVGDSKRVYASGGVAALERSVLAFVAASGGRPPVALDDLLESVGVAPRDRRARAWYAAETPSFPFHTTAAEIAGAAGRLCRALVPGVLAPVGLSARVVDERRLNALFAERGNKATVLFDLSTDVLAALLDLARPGEPVLAVFDRQGGRKNYLPPLQQRFPEGFVWRVSEGRNESAYRFQVGGHDVLARFVVRGDAQAPQVGLASMLAKYLREVHMRLWNAWFADLCPGVRPTAGYVTDGRRWLDESRPARSAAGISDADLTRTR